MKQFALVLLGVSMLAMTGCCMSPHGCGYGGGYGAGYGYGAGNCATGNCGVNPGYGAPGYGAPVYGNPTYGTTVPQQGAFYNSHQPVESYYGLATPLNFAPAPVYPQLSQLPLEPLPTY